MEGLSLQYENVIIENERLRLKIGGDCQVQSLILKATGEELLRSGEGISLFSVTQERPFNNEVKLAHPNKRTTFQANRIRREGDRLIVGFEITPFEAVVEIRECPRYISFHLADFIVHPADYEGLCMDTPPAAEFRLLQLPVKNRENFGEWLNVCWDRSAAVNVLSVSPHARIDSERRLGYRVMSADAVRDIRLKGIGAALIVDTPDALMDDVAAVEEDYDLPRGVASRRGPMINASVYWAGDVTPRTVDEHIRYAKMGGFRLMLIYYTALFKTNYGYDTCGDYDYREEYPNGRADLETMLSRIKEAGITPGLHFLHTHIGIKSRYVTPVADHRLNKTRRFTLARPLDAQETTVYVDQNPEGAVLADRCRILQFGGELISYQSYETEPPYRFTGCTRGLYDTIVQNHPLGLTGGIVDVSEFGHGHSFYLDQNTGLQDEVADKLADAYGAGFEFVYFDGSEGTNAPFEFHVPNAQYRVYRKLNPAPLFSEGAAKAHFSWHFLSGGNAFDIFPPEVFKQKICEFPAEEAPRMRRDFTRLNFGWWAFWAPGHPNGSVTGIQPDMYEFGLSRAAAWDCPATMQANLKAFREHPRTADIMEVMRRWEDVRAKNWLTEAHKQALKDLMQEHILLIDGNGEYELVPYNQIAQAADGDARLRSFLFERQGMRYVVYWHVSGSGTLSLPVDPNRVIVANEPDGDALPLDKAAGGVLLPADGRRYLKTDLTSAELIRAFEAARFTD